MNYIIEIVKSLEESGLLVKRVSETIQNEPKEQKRGFLRMLLGTWTATLLGKLLTDKWAMRAVKGTIGAGQDFQCRIIF